MPARFTDSTLISILQKAGRRVNRRLCLTGTTSEIAVSSSGVVTPSNGDVEDIVLLQAECMIASREFQQELSDGTAGLLVKDGEQTLDTRGTIVARGTFFDSPHSPCAELIEAVKLYKIANITGRLIW
jgi:hypothetical protein